MANICVYAAADKNKPIAIVVPVEAALKSLAKQNGISGDTIESLADNKKIRDLALAEIQKEGKNGGLTGIEIIDGIVLAKKEWTPQNVGLLSPPSLSLINGVFN